MNQAVSLLVQIISQGGIGGGCAAVCGQLRMSISIIQLELFLISSAIMDGSNLLRSL
jgi:hypothetical protein